MLKDFRVRVKVKDGQVIVSEKVCGVVFSFPQAVWPSEYLDQLSWVRRLTPWWDVTATDWTPQSARLREYCHREISKAINQQKNDTKNEH